MIQLFRHVIRTGLLFSLLVSVLSPASWVVLHPLLMSAQPPNDPREGWAVLMEMNFYPSGSDLETNYSDTRKWNSTLHALGWQSNHILIYQGPITQQTGVAALQFLALNADANDVVLFFIFAHGNYLLNDAHWQSWFPTYWTQLVSQEKLLVVAACTSALMLEHLYDDPAAHVHMASVESDEYAWAGLPSEGLPIIGEVFNHFLTNALVNGSADTNTDGEVTVEEAFYFASPLSRDYLSSVVFPAFPAFAELCNNTAPHPVIDDAYPGNFSLQVEMGDPPVTPSWLSFEQGLLIAGITTCVFVLVLGFFVMRRRTK